MTMATGHSCGEGGSAAFPRIVGDARQTPVASIYPNGYLPIIATDIEDSTAAFGLKGDLAGFKVDLNVVYGKNKIDYRTESSANASYGAASQTSFNSGGMTYDQTVVGLDVSRGIDIGAYEPLLDRARREALLRMKADARGADAIINVRFETSAINGSERNRSVAGVEMFAYGTALRLKQGHAALHT